MLDFTAFFIDRSITHWMSLYETPYKRFIYTDCYIEYYDKTFTSLDLQKTIYVDAIPTNYRLPLHVWGHRCDQQLKKYTIKQYNSSGKHETFVFYFFFASKFVEKAQINT